MFCKTAEYVFIASEEEESIPNVSDPDSFEKSTLPKSEVEFKITL